MLDVGGSNVTEKKDKTLGAIDLQEIETAFGDADDLASAISEALQDADSAMGKRRKSRDGDSDSTETEIQKALKGAGAKRPQNRSQPSTPPSPPPPPESPMGLAEVPGETVQNERATISENGYYERYLRLMADFENYKKRVVREKREFSRFASEDIILSLLPLMDNFERAITHCKDSGDSGEINVLLDGVVMIQRQMVDVLKKSGVRSFESLGKPFDPTKHQAMQTVESKDVEPNTVIDEFQKGYFLHDRLIRPAMVVVSQKPKIVQEAPEEEEPLVDVLDVPDDGIELANADPVGVEPVGITLELDSDENP